MCHTYKDLDCKNTEKQYYVKICLYSFKVIREIIFLMRKT